MKDMKADKIYIRKGDWIRIVSKDYPSFTMQGLVYHVDKTHLSIKPARDYIRSEFIRSGITILEIKSRTRITNWWNLL